MKTISRDAIQRMTGSGSGGVSVGGGGGASIDLTGYATEMWTEENYVGKEFFSSLFKAYDSNGNEVLPNDTETEIDNIKAMFGFWTDFYISALGTGGQQSVGLRLAQLADVNVAGVQNDQVLKYDATSQKWVPGTASSGTDMATVWLNLAASGNQQINYSHISGAVSLSNGTITIGSSSITPITSHQSLAGYAKEQWVSQNYLSKNDAAETYLSKTDAASTYLSIAFFNRLFKAYNGTTQVNPNDTATTIDNIKAMFGFWTEQYITSLGKGSDSGGSGMGDVTWALLADNTDRRQIAPSHLTNALSSYNPKSNFKTINGVSIIGAGNIYISGGGIDMATVWSNLASNGNQQVNYSHLSDAISLSGNTITIGSSSITPITSHQSLTGYATTQWVGQNYLALTGGTITGSLTVNSTLSTGGNTTVGGDLTINGGDLTVNEPNASGASAIRFQSGGTTYGNLRVKPDNGEFYFYQGTANSGQSSVCVNAGWFYSYGQVTALSDARMKDVQGDLDLTIDNIAGAPAIKFTWKGERAKEGLQAGTLAQYWQNVLPMVVKDKGGELSMQYGVTALASSIIIARKVVDHEKRIQELERENKRLKEMLNVA